MSLKHQSIYEYIHQKIISGEIPYGHKIPTEFELAEIFNLSRPTIARGLNDLESSGYIIRKAGAGSFVSWKEKVEPERKLVGLLTDGNIRVEETNKLTQSLSSVGLRNKTGLIHIPRINSSERKKSNEDVSQFIKSNRLQGTFYIPSTCNLFLEFIDSQSQPGWNTHSNPVIVLNQTDFRWPEKIPFDLVEFDMYSAGWKLAQSLVESGVQRTIFISESREGEDAQNHNLFLGSMAAWLACGLKPRDLICFPFDIGDVQRSTNKLIDLICQSKKEKKRALLFESSSLSQTILNELNGAEVYQSDLFHCAAPVISTGEVDLKHKCLQFRFNPEDLASLAFHLLETRRMNPALTNFKTLIPGILHI